MSAKHISNHDLTEQIAATLRQLIEPGQVTELRALNFTRPGLTLSGYFDDQHLDRMAVSAVAVEAECSGVYFMLNPLRPELLSRRANEVDRARKGELAGDADVLRRVRLLVDIDPIRPGTVSATKEEKRWAAEGMVRVHNHLHERGWPAPLVVDSGNGYQLLFRVDLPSDNGGLVKRVLHALAQRFNTEQVHVDTSVFNPARICKLPGTLARKGVATRERPHRRSKVVQHGGSVCVPRDLLEALAAEVASPKAVVLAPRTQRQQSPEPSQVVQRARAYLAAMPPAISGQGGHDQTFAAACAFAVGFGLTVDEARPLLSEYSQRCVPP